tara:strand:+ start:390 stop:1739 length:1350 start_codon:yes stop_codon:yes gene_type:complete
MTVRVEKPTFTLRDKMNELDLPIGDHGLEILNSRNPEETFNLARANRRRLNANGDMRICQTASTSGLFNSGTHSSHGPDLWQHLVVTAGTWRAVQDNDTPYHKEFPKSLKLECTSSTGTLSAGSYFYSVYRMECVDSWVLQYGTLYAKPVTVSFWIKSNKTGIISVNLENESNNHSGGGDSTCVRRVRIEKPNTWEHKTVTYPGDYNFQMDYHTNKGAVIEFFWTGGTNYSNNSANLDTEKGNFEQIANPSATDIRAHPVADGGINFADSTSNYINLTGVQMEIGEVATPYEHRDYSEELIYCMRRIQVLGCQYGIAPGAYAINNGSAGAFAGYSPNQSDYNVIGRGWTRNNGIFQTMTFLPVSMRGMPSASVYDFDDVNSPSNSFYAQYEGSSTQNVTFNAINPNGSSTHAIWLDWDQSSNVPSVTPCHVGSRNSSARRNAILLSAAI